MTFISFSHTINFGVVTDWQGVVFSLLYAPIAQLARASDQFIRTYMELTSKQKGNLTELQCLTAFIKAGLTVSIPYGDCARYDFIIEYQNKLYKVQCKTSHLFGDSNDGIVFACRSTINSKERRYSKDEIDYFCTYYDNKCYLVPVEECSVEKKLRFIPPKNNQKVGISYAKDYELDIQLSKISQG